MIRAKGQDREWSRQVNMDQLIPDHNHLMHLFLISTPGMDHMWHLHPDLVGGGAFADNLPTMPAGHYQVFADIVDKNGFPWTLVGSIDLPAINGKPLAGDDSSWSGPPLSSSADSTTAALADGGCMIWERPSDPLKANTAMEFKFSVQDKDGKPARDVEPYMGMAGHAEFVSSDLSVFAHIHPAGSVSMAALELAQTGLMDASSSMPGMQMAMPMSSGRCRPR